MAQLKSFESFEALFDKKNSETGLFFFRVSSPTTANTAT